MIVIAQRMSIGNGDEEMDVMIMIMRIIDHVVLLTQIHDHVMAS